jgi:hypothetical protein
MSAAIIKRWRVYTSAMTAGDQKKNEKARRSTADSAARGRRQSLYSTR